MIKQILEGWSQQVDNEDVVKTLLTKVIHVRNAGYASGLVGMVYGC